MRTEKEQEKARGPLTRHVTISRRPVTDGVGHRFRFHDVHGCQTLLNVLVY